MTTPATPAPAHIAAEWTEGLRYVARQPILDLRGRVHAYELLFRAGPEMVFRGDFENASRIMLDNAVMFGMERLTGGLPAFVNCTGETLTEDLVDVLGTTTVLEILETVDPTPNLIATCRSLKAKGYRLALDDFVWEPKFDALMDLADYIKVDFVLTEPEQRLELFQRLGSRPIVMLAEKVETQEEYQQAKEEGFTLFQGYYFCRPVLVKNRIIPANRVVHFEILQLLQGNDIDLGKASHLMKRNPSLTYRLLRLVNSSAYAIRKEITSIQEALLVVGENTFRRVVTLAIASDLNGDQPLEILRMAFVRARFCELASERCGLCPSEQYLLGMFSMLPAMMLRSMEALAPELPLRDGIRAALNGAANRERVPLGWLERHEHGDWATCDVLVGANGVTGEEMVGFYRSALMWASAALGSTG
jgi:EAL and modified HD-GYP domain-containing signal transduction protein